MIRKIKRSTARALVLGGLLAACAGVTSSMASGPSAADDSGALSRDVAAILASSDLADESEPMDVRPGDVIEVASGKNLVTVRVLTVRNR